MNNAGMNLIVNATNKEKFLVFTLIIFIGPNNFSIAVTMPVIVVVKVRMDAIDMNKMNLHTLKMPSSKSFLEKRAYISNIKKKMKKNGLRLLNKKRNFNLDNAINNKKNI